MSVRVGDNVHIGENVFMGFMNLKKGFTCGAFDLLHVGHVLMLKECKDHCDFLVVGLQRDPNVDRPEKNKPV